LIGSLIGLAVAGTFLSNAYHAMVWGMFALVLGLLKVARLQGVDAAGRGVRESAAAPSRGPRRRNTAFAPVTRARPYAR
jgi:hypothetical protein